MSKKQTGFYTTEERLDRSHECNNRCDKSKLIHFYIPTVTPTVLIWNDFVDEALYEILIAL